MTDEQKFVIALVEYDLDYKTWAHPDKHELIQRVSSELYGEGLLVLDYDKQCRLRYVPEGDIIDIDKFRKYWMKAYSGRTGYASTKDVVEKLLRAVMKRYNITFEQCCLAAKEYVDSTDKQYLLKCDNFILDKHDKSHLAAIVEDSSERSSVKWL